MKTKLIPVIVAIASLASSQTLLAQGCCAGGGAMQGGCCVGGSAGAGPRVATSLQNANATARLAPPVQAVFDNYFKVQQSLAQDSLEGIPTAADLMAKAIRGDSTQTLSQKVAVQAEALAGAKDLQAARAAFKPLSESLIQHLKSQKVPPGTYHEAYCPMAKASWLQTGTIIMNPYMGKSMTHCGQIKS